MNLITSNKNLMIKNVKALKGKKVRDEKKLYFIEGLKMLEEALKEEEDIINIFFSQEFLSRYNSDKGGPANSDRYSNFENLLSIIATERIKAQKIECFVLPEKLFREISDTENPQGVLATVRQRDLLLNSTINNKSSLVVLDKIQDPGNIGTIIRTADAAGFDGIIISKGSVDLYNPKVVRSTMGSIFRLPIIFSENLVETISSLKSKGISVIAAHLKGNMNYFDIDMSCGTAIIIGNESQGINDDISSLADLLVRIPMEGKTESLNASVAAGLLIYEVYRQKLSKICFPK